MKDLMRETQPKDLEDAQLKEGEMVEDFISKALRKGMIGIVRWKNSQTLQEKGRRRSNVHIYSPTIHSRHPRTPPTPAPSEDRLFTDWSSTGSRSPPVVPPPQSVPMGGTLITPGIEGIHEAEKAAPQPSQPFSQESHIDTTSHVV